jgi:hypothetical protein
MRFHRRRLVVSRGAAQRLMELEVKTLTGAANGARDPDLLRPDGSGPLVR